MLAQYLALKGATNLRKSIKISAKAVNSLQIKRERRFMSICSWNASALFSKNTLNEEASDSALFSICS